MSAVRFEKLGRGFHLLSLSTEVPLDRAAVFDFFADAGNLERITPPTLSFRIETPRPIEMGTGTLIDYRLRINGFPVRWRTEIAAWDPPRSFTDTQIRGPYHTWVHRHSFEELHEGEKLQEPEESEDVPRTRMTDEVRFRLPLWPLGDVALPFVRRELRKIFEFRGRKIREILLEDESDRGTR